ncbi:TPA: fimbrial protein [Escherichia coli]|uniref:fimbrial protein n=1 Tax=Escherichia coli TaxID=562 RepID=UPI0015EABA8B|nr:fimbrial protein [Escherichia coli]EFH4853762.1 fimbrial protein [Escherichia coli]EFH6320155.1 fimbrial protein [Escherichia coli]EFK5231372.1 fimbrial protein [Escherichia coli]ELO9329336.1 fimbrial protein [Escherichia coli]ELX1806762.1 fimbrial protein [Escherichia coli]
MKNTILFSLVCIPLFLRNVMADEININITGQIYDAPCKINNDVMFDIDFGKVAIQDIDGKKFKQTKTVEIECVNNSGIPYITLVSSTGTLGENILNTAGVNTSSLGIALYQGDAVDPNYPLKINFGKDEIKKGLSQKNVQKSYFTFTAVPYKYGAVLTAGKFNATVTMNIFYI